MNKEKPKFLFWNLGFILQFHNLLAAYKATFIWFANMLEVTRVEQRGYHQSGSPWDIGSGLPGSSPFLPSEWIQKSNKKEAQELW